MMTCGAFLWEIVEMSETDRSMAFRISEPKGQGFEAGEQFDRRHNLKHRLRLVASPQICKMSCEDLLALVFFTYDFRFHHAKWLDSMAFDSDGLHLVVGCNI